MADLVITEANVKYKSKAVSRQLVQVGETVARAQPLYLKSSDSKYWLASNDVDDASADVKGISMTGAAADGYVDIVQSGPMDVGATLTQGEGYLLSATPGKIMPTVDLASGNRRTRLGHASGTSIFEVDIKATGVQK